MNKQITIQLSEELGIREDILFTEIERWNKKKMYPATLIKITMKENTLTDNSDKIGELIDKAIAHAKEVIKNELDLEKVKASKKQLSILEKFLSETRKIITSPLIEVPKKYIVHEKRLAEEQKEVTLHIEKMQEKGFKEREKILKEYIQTFLDENYDDIFSIELYKDFIENKRKTQILTDKKAIKKATKDEIAEVARVAFEPIKAEREKQEKVNLQSRQFGVYLEGIPTHGESEVLEASIIAFERLRVSVDELYPAITDEATRRLGEAISRAKSNIKANEVTAKDTTDDEYLGRVKKIEDGLLNMLLEKDELEQYKARLIELYKLMTIQENKDKVTDIGISINNRLEKLKDETKEDTIKEDVELKTYTISIENLSLLTEIDIHAENEDEAKIKAVEIFRTHLGMIELKEKKCK